MASSLGFYDRNDLHGSPIIKNQWMFNCNSWEHFFIITLTGIGYCNCGSIKCPLVLEWNHLRKILWCFYLGLVWPLQVKIHPIWHPMHVRGLTNKEQILKCHMILWQRWDHGSSSVDHYETLNCGFEHFIYYCDFMWLTQISFVCVNQILWNPQ